MSHVYSFRPGVLDLLALEVAGYYCDMHSLIVDSLESLFYRCCFVSESGTVGDFERFSQPDDFELWLA